MKKIYSLFILFFIVNIAFSQVVIEWQKCYGGIGEEVANCIIQTMDGGYIFAGSSTYNDGDVSNNYGFEDVWIVKLDMLGNIIWEKTYGGSGIDMATDIIQTNDGDYLIAAYSNSTDHDVTNNYGDSDFWVFKIDSLGNILWEKSYGTPTFDLPTKISKSLDGGYLVSGITGHPSDYYAIKIDFAGNIQWQKVYGGTLSDFSFSNIALSDGGYILAGYARSTNFDVMGNHGSADGWIVKIDDNGDLQWQKCIGGTSWDDVYCINETNDGGFILAGGTFSNDGDVSGNNGLYDYWIIKIDSLANIQWQKCLGGSLSEKANFIKQTFDGGYIIAGYSASNDGDVSGNHGNNDYWIVKTDSLGNIEWQKSLGGSNSDIARYIQQVNYGEYIIVGYTYSNDGDVTGNHGNGDVWIIKISDPTAIKSTKKDFDLSLFPNPTTRELYITFQLDKSSNVKIELYNSLGQLTKTIINKKLISGENKINLSTENIPPGIYHLIFSVDGELNAKKVVKM